MCAWHLFNRLSNTGRYMSGNNNLGVKRLVKKYFLKKQYIHVHVGN